MDSRAATFAAIQAGETGKLRALLAQDAPWLRPRMIGSLRRHDRALLPPGG